VLTQIEKLNDAIFEVPTTVGIVSYHTCVKELKVSVGNTLT
jgi:hypothetical protein